MTCSFLYFWHFSTTSLHSRSAMMSTKSSPSSSSSWILVCWESFLKPPFYLFMNGMGLEILVVLYLVLIPMIWLYPPPIPEIERVILLALIFTRILSVLANSSRLMELSFLELSFLSPSFSYSCSLSLWIFSISFCCFSMDFWIKSSSYPFKS